MKKFQMSERTINKVVTLMYHIERMQDRLATLRASVYAHMLALGINEWTTKRGHKVSLISEIETGWIKLTPEIKDILSHKGIVYEVQTRAAHLLIKRNKI